MIIPCLQRGVRAQNCQPLAHNLPPKHVTPLRQTYLPWPCQYTRHCSIVASSSKKQGKVGVVINTRLHPYLLALVLPRFTSLCPAQAIDITVISMLKHTRMCNITDAAV